MEDAEDALKQLSEAGARAFITLESAFSENPKVVCVFRTHEDAWAFYRALINCGNVARAMGVEDEK